MSKYKISIIIPTFNIENDLKRAMDSLLRQSINFNNLEVILVDDHSTDNTQKIILDYAKNYSNIKYIFLETNSGSAGKPRNIGIEYATADYIMFLDNDDEYIDEAFEIFYNEIKKNDANLIVCSKTNNIFKLEDKPPKISEKPLLKEINVLKNPDSLYAPNTSYAGAMWNKIFKRDFLLNNNIKCLENLPEDVYFMHQCYYLNPNVLFLTNLSLYNHYFCRVSGTSITVSSSYEFLTKSFQMYGKLKELSTKYSNSDKFFKRYSQLYFNVLIYNIIITNSTKQQKKDLMNSFLYHLNGLNLKTDNILYYLWLKLVKNQKFDLCFIYSQFIKFAINFKSKINKL